MTKQPCVLKAVPVSVDKLTTTIFKSMKEAKKSNLSTKIKEIKDLFGNEQEIRFSKLDINDKQQYEAFRYMEDTNMIETYFEGYKVFLKRNWNEDKK